MATRTITNQKDFDDYLNKFQELIYNTVLTRSMFFSEVIDRRAKIDEACGYPHLGTNISIAAYRDLYDREPIANRVVNLWPRESWKVQPKVLETEDQSVTEFEEGWENLCRTIRGEQNWYQDALGSSVWEYLWRADELSGIGTYGIILLGFADGKLLEQPVDGSPPDGNPYTIPNVASSGLPAGARVMPGAFGSQAGVDPIPIRGPAGIQDTSKSIYGNPQSEVDAQSALMDSYASVSRDIYGGATQNPMSSVLGTDAQYRGIQFTPGFYPNGDPTGPINPYAQPNVPPTLVQKNGKNPQQQPLSQLLFMRVFDESLVQVVQYEADLRNPRFGQPIMYLVTLNDPRYPHTGIGLPLATLRVHWSRVIHLADNIRSSEIFGLPRMQPVFNRLLDLRKLYGGSAEMYWQGALPGISFETNPQLGGDVAVNVPEMQDMIRRYTEGLERFLHLRGMTARTLAPTVVDASNQVQTQIEAICIQLGIPIRVFKGSERGELASSQDDANWNDRLRHRQQTYISPRVITPFINRLILLGILPPPKGYSIKWPDLESQSDAIKASIASQKTQAMATYTGGQAQTLMAPVDYLVRILGFDQTAAKQIAEAGEEYKQILQKEQMEQAEQQAELQAQAQQSQIHNQQVYNAENAKNIEERLHSLKPKIARAAQEEYDAWAPDYDEYGDPEVGCGGICDRVADRISHIVHEHFHDHDVETIEGGQPGDDHSYNIYRIGKQHFGVDIYPHHYETGAGYNWKKIPNVKLQPHHVDIWKESPPETLNVDIGAASENAPTGDERDKWPIGTVLKRTISDKPYNYTKTKAGWHAVSMEKKTDRFHKQYAIHVDPQGSPIRCTCPDFVYRKGYEGGCCKHMAEVNKIEEENPEGPETPTSNAKIGDHKVAVSSIYPESMKVLKRLGIKSQGHLLHAIGAPTDIAIAAHTVSPGPGGKLVRTYVHTPDYYMIRYFYPDKKVVRNHLIEATSTGQGLGSTIFHKQVQHLTHLGFNHISALAATGTDSQGRPMNGYSTWPKLGYNGRWNDADRNLLPLRFQHTKTLQELHHTPGGPEWWDRHGWSKELKFDLRPGSLSHEILDHYMTERAKRIMARKGKSTQNRDTSMTLTVSSSLSLGDTHLPPREEITLEPWEREALDAVWAQRSHLAPTPCPQEAIDE